MRTTWVDDWLAAVRDGPRREDRAAVAKERQSIQELQGRLEGLRNPAQLDGEVRDLQKAVAEAEADVERLRAEYQAVRDALERRRREIAEKAVFDCERLIETLEAEHHQEVLADAERLFRADLPAGFGGLSPAQMEQILRQRSAVVQDLRSRIRDQFRLTAQEVAGKACLLEEVRSLEADLAAKAAEKDALVKDLQERHGVDPTVTTALLGLAPDVEEQYRDLYLDQWRDVARVEAAWRLPRDVFAEVRREHRQVQA